VNKIHTQTTPKKLSLSYYKMPIRKGTQNARVQKWREYQRLVPNPSNRRLKWKTKMANGKWKAITVEQIQNEINRIKGFKKRERKVKHQVDIKSAIVRLAQQLREPLLLPIRQLEQRGLLNQEWTRLNRLKNARVMRRSKRSDASFLQEGKEEKKEVKRREVKEREVKQRPENKMIKTFKRLNKVIKKDVEFIKTLNYEGKKTPKTARGKKFRKAQMLGWRKKYNKSSDVDMDKFIKKKQRLRLSYKLLVGRVRQQGRVVSYLNRLDEVWFITLRAWRGDEGSAFHEIQDKTFVINDPLVGTTYYEPLVNSPKDGSSVYRTNVDIRYDIKKKEKVEKKMLKDEFNRASGSGSSLVMVNKRTYPNFMELPENKQIALCEDLYWSQVMERNTAKNPKPILSYYSFPPFTVRPVKEYDPDRFKGIEVKAFNAPEFTSLGDNSSEWNTKYEKCAINAIMYFLSGTKSFKYLSRDKIYKQMECKADTPITVNMVLKWHQDNKINSYFVDGSNVVLYRVKYPSNKKMTCYYKIANNHIYPITDKATQNEIVYSNVIKNAKISWGDKQEYIQDLDFDKFKNVMDLENKSKIIITSNYENNSHLNKLAMAIFKTYNHLVENIKLDSSNNIKYFSYFDKWYVIKEDHKQVNNILEQTKTIEKVKASSTRLLEYNYTGQTSQSITKNIIELLTNNPIPMSQFNNDVFDNFNRYKKGAYNASVGEINHDTNLVRTVDIRRCYTTICYTRKHRWGIFNVWDEFKDFKVKRNGWSVYPDGRIEYDFIHDGAYYIVKNVKMGSMVLGDICVDSEFVEKALTRKVIEIKQIIKEMKPFEYLEPTYFKDIIDQLYTTYSDADAKEMFNKFIGTLASTGKYTKNAFLSTSREMSNEWITREYKAKTPFETKDNIPVNCSRGLGDLYINWTQGRERVLETNMSIFYAIVAQGWLELYDLEQVLKPYSTETIRFHTDSVSVRIKQHVAEMVEEEPELPKWITDNEKDMNIRETLREMLRSTNKTSYNPLQVLLEKHQREIKWGLGKYRVEDYADIGGDNPDDYEPIDFKENKYERVYLKDPSDYKLPPNRRGLWIRGGGGRGKSYNIKNRVIPLLVEAKERYKCVSCTNMAISNLVDAGVAFEDVKTLHGLFTAHGESMLSHLNKLTNLYDCIICDEYTMCSHYHFGLLYRLYCKGVRIVLVGDSKQLPSIDDQLLKYKEFQFFQAMIGLEVELTINYRMDKDLDALCQKVYNEGVFKWTLEDNKKYDNELGYVCNTIDIPYDSKMTNKQLDKIIAKKKMVRYNSNIVYKNDTRYAINGAFSEMLGDRKNFIWGTNEQKFVVGSEIVCHQNKKSIGLFNGRRFIITDIKSEIKEDEEGVQDYIQTCKIVSTDKKKEELEIDRKTLKYCFDKAEAITIYKYQGSQTNKITCMWDIDYVARWKDETGFWHSRGISRERLYTMLSRCTSYKNIRVPNNIDMKDIKNEIFWDSNMRGWTTKYEFGKKSADIYEIVYDGKVLHIGYTNDFTKDTIEKHLTTIYDKELKWADRKITNSIWYEFREKKIPKDDIKFNIIQSVRYKDTHGICRIMDKIKDKIYRSGKVLYNEDGVEIIHVVKKLKKRKYKKKERKTDTRGSISSDKKKEKYVRFEWYNVEGKKKEKRWRVGKKRTFEQCELLAKQFQHDHNAKRFE